MFESYTHLAFYSVFIVYKYMENNILIFQVIIFILFSHYVNIIFILLYTQMIIIIIILDKINFYNN